MLLPAGCPSLSVIFAAGRFSLKPRTMKILDALHRDAILTNLSSRDKEGLIEELAVPVARIVGVSSAELVHVLMERERLGSTGIGMGIGIPHGKLKSLDGLVMGFGLSRKGVDYDTLDGRPAHLFFMLITPENSTGLHLKALARIARMLKNEPFKEKLLRAQTPDDIIAIIQAEDEDF
jgi:PTS system nitrogen regulatory IIA component